MENSKSNFDIIMENCPYLKGIIEEKIELEVGSVKRENDKLMKQIVMMESALDDILMGGK